MLDLDWIKKSIFKILFIVWGACWRACVTCPIWRSHGAAEVWLTHIKGYLPSSGKPRQILKQRLRGKSTGALQSSLHSIKSTNSLLLHLKSNPGYISNPLRHISSLHIKCVEWQKCTLQLNVLLIFIAFHQFYLVSIIFYTDYINSF